MLYYRQINKMVKNVYDDPGFWRFINLTDYQTIEPNQIINSFNKNFVLYNLSGKNILEYPKSLIPLMNNANFIIY